MEEQTSAPATKGLLSSRHIGRAFMIGIALVAIGFAAEAWVPPLIDYINSFRAGYSGPAAGRSGAGPGHGPLYLAVLLLKELGVAFLVAGIIGWAIEKQARERDNERAVQLRQEVANDAIFAIYGLRHRKDFVMAVVETNLGAKIVRENLVLKYKLRNLYEEEARTISPTKHEDALQRFVMLEMFSSYDFRNVAAAEEEVPISYVIDLRQGAGARKLTEVHYVCIGDDVFTQSEIDDHRKSTDNPDELRYGWQPRLGANRTLRVIICARCVKVRSDNEVWGSHFPTMGDVSLTLEVLPGMRFGASSLSNAVLAREPSEPSEVAKSWKMRGPLLRHNSMVVWWRKPEDDAEDVVSAPVQFAEPEPEPAPAPPAERPGLLRRFVDSVSGNG